ncbi:hypothetical protein [Flavobacterium sp. Arc2]|uniref:hypothetical protein n=1 Tax=Flavobacterium sp. Arc2 TaxID=3046685 RepID=UPI00352D018C
MNENSVGDLEILINCTMPTDFWRFFEIIHLSKNNVVLIEKDKNPESKQFLDIFIRVAQKLELEISIE